MDRSERGSGPTERERQALAAEIAPLLDRADMLGLDDVALWLNQALVAIDGVGQLPAPEHQPDGRAEDTDGHRAAMGGGPAT